MVVALLEIRISKSSARTFLRWKILSNFVHLVGNEKLRSLLVLCDKAVYPTKQSLQGMEVSRACISPTNVLLECLCIC